MKMWLGPRLAKEAFRIVAQVAAQIWSGTAFKGYSVPTESRELVTQGSVFPSPSDHRKLFPPGDISVVCRAEGVVCECTGGRAVHWLPAQMSFQHQGWPGAPGKPGVARTSGSGPNSVICLLNFDRG